MNSIILRVKGIRIFMLKCESNQINFKYFFNNSMSNYSECAAKQGQKDLLHD